MLGRKNIKCRFTLLLSFVMTLSLFSNSPIKANDTVDLYPYTIFAASNEEGAIFVTADNFCVNGNVASNGTIVSTGNVNINGTKTENASEDMIYIFNKIDTTYFSDDDVETHAENYFLEDLNININHPLEVEGEAALIGNININTAFKASEDISLQGEVKNTNDSIIASENGNIVIDSQNVNLNGLVYAPFGEVNITAQNLTLNSVIIIADKVTINCPSVNANYNNDMAAFIGTNSEQVEISDDEKSDMTDENENGLPDFYEDISNWYCFEDTDKDLIPDVIEAWLNSNPNMQDTDGDGLDDFFEMTISLTDLTLADTDNNGISDGDEDLDADSLTNIEEYQLGTHPLLADSDGDKLNDYEEIYVSFTNPNEKDTDEDGANDKWEIDNGFNPSVYNASFAISAQAEGKNITASVSIKAAGSQVESLSVEPADDLLLLDDSVPGYIGSPFRFEIDGTFEQAAISFTFDAQYLNDMTFIPTIYYYNEEMQLLEELPTTVDGNVATAVTTHFSTYILLDKATYEAAWETMQESDNNANVEKVNIAFVVDVSGSMVKRNLPVAKMVIGNFIGRIKKSGVNTNVALVEFESTSHTVCDLTDEYDTFLLKLSGLSGGGGTNICNGINEGLTVLDVDMNKQNVQNIIILLTDGYDNYGVKKEGYLQAVARAKNQRTKIYTVGVGYVDESLLMSVADATGGAYFFADYEGKLYEIYEDIHSEIFDYTTDSNHDGISDYFTKCLCDGTLRVGTQCNIFDGISYEAFNANDDYDGDGIINGDEFEIRYAEKRNRIYVYLHSNPVEADSDFDGVDDSIDDNPFDSGTGFLIYESSKTDKKLKGLSFADRPEDYKYADKSIDEIRAMKFISWMDFLGQEKDVYANNFKSLLSLCSTGDMSDVAYDMANHFLDGTGTDYSNSVLSKTISENEKTDAYVNAVSKIVDEHIKTNQGDISGLAYIDGTEFERKQGVMVKNMRYQKIAEPHYTEPFSGLGICVDSLYGNRFEITSYKFDGKNYEYTLRFTFYDVFGLDSGDIKDSGVSKHFKFGMIGGFRSWYILQHCNLYNGDYKPYISYMTFERTFQGQIE
ncbi:MAG: DUF3289 family protein [Clostridium sp.]|nr:DUF3289 family protein [Clostridium sp.]MCM1460775.1 DUF3289 family protein [Bacteroides sp.]